MTESFLISIVGPTAVGKTSMAIKLAEDLKCEIISADSRQFYREMEIGTAKPNKNELSRIKHHFINSLSIQDDYNVGDFEKDANQLLSKLFVSHHDVIMVGGSGLFCKAVWEGMDEMPEIKKGIREQLNNEFKKKGIVALQEELKERDLAYFEKVDIHNPMRIIRALEVIRSTGKTFSGFRKKKPVDRPFKNIKIGLEMDRQEIYERINTRMDVMLADGLEKEAKKLHEFKHLNALQTVGYSELFGYFEGEYDYDEAVRLLKRNSRRYAKRQLTWFKKDSEIAWYHPDDYASVLKYVKEQKFKSNA